MVSAQSVAFYYQIHFKTSKLFLQGPYTKTLNHKNKISNLRITVSGIPRWGHNYFFWEGGINFHWKTLIPVVYGPDAIARIKKKRGKTAKYFR